MFDPVQRIAVAGPHASRSVGISSALRPDNIIANKQALIKIFLEQFTIGLLTRQIRTGAPDAWSSSHIWDFPLEAGTRSPSSICPEPDGQRLSGLVGWSGIKRLVRVKSFKHIGDGCLKEVDIAALFDVDFPSV